MFGARDRLTQLAIMEQLARMQDQLKAIRRDLDSALDADVQRKTGELVSEGITNLMNYAGYPKKKQGD